MQKSIQINKILPALILSLIFINFSFADNYHNGKGKGKIIVANRGSGSISIIDTRSDNVSVTISLPAADNPPEPMYVVHSPKSGRVFVGDRANNYLVIFDDEDFAIQGTVPAGKGIFHMWADPGDNQLWVNNDIDRTITVIDPVSLSILATITLPADLVALGGKPHDVILDPTGNSAYISILGVSGPNDYVVKYSTDSFRETARTAVGKDPHLSLTRRNKLLYVPCQNSDAVFVLQRSDLALVKTINVPGAHGAGMPRHGKTFYTTNIPGGGDNGIYSINTRQNNVLNAPVDTPFPVPHNIAINNSAAKLYVTHSGAGSDQVSVYKINRQTQQPVFATTVTVGQNPFGLAFVH